MILVVVTARILPEKTADYEAMLSELLPRMKAAEPGLLVYDVGRSRDEPCTYRHIEVYRDQEAIDAHRANEIVNEMKPALFACVAGGYEGYDVRFHDTF